MEKYLLFLLGFFPFSGWAQFNNTGNLQLFTGAQVAFFGDFANSGTVTDNGLSVRFSGNVNQTVSGSSVTTFRNLILNNSAGLTLNQNLTVGETLNLTAGAFRLNSRVLLISSGAGSAVTRGTGYVLSEQTDNSGRLRWNIGSTAGAHEFPFGTAAGVYIPFTLNLTAGNIGNVTLATYPTTVNNMPYPSTPNPVTTMVDSSGLDNSLNTADRFWQIDKDGPSGTATLTFTATPAEMGSIQYVIKARRWNTATLAWEAPLPGQTFTAVSATVPNVSAFSPWTVAGAVIPLPITLLDFGARSHDQRTVDLDWTTASEINNDFFTVERSQDLLTFEEVLTRDGAGNSNHPLHYADVDPAPYRGISYYRLKQTDFDGNFSYSAPVSVNLDGAAPFDASVFPNPAGADELYLSVSGLSGTGLFCELENAAGQRIWNLQRLLQGQTGLLQKLDIGRPAAGLYFLRVVDGDRQKIVRVILR